MSISDKYTFYWTVFVGIPFGVICLINGISLFFTIPSNVDNLEKYSGRIEDYGFKEVYFETVDTKGNFFFIKLKKSDEFYNDLKKNRKILKDYIKEKNLKNMMAIIWTEKGDNIIKQISINNKIIISYDPPYWMAWTFFIAGIIITTGAIFYLKKNAGDIEPERGLLGRILFGKKKRR